MSLLTGGKLTMSSGTLILNNSVAGTSSLNGLVLTCGTGTIQCKKTTAINLLNQVLFNLTIADPSTSCTISAGPNIVLNEFKVNGGTFNSTGTLVLKKIGGLTTTTSPLQFVAGSDITGGVAITIREYAVIITPELNGATMACSLYFRYGTSPSFAGKITCAYAELTGDGHDATLTSNGYSMAFTGGAGYAFYCHRNADACNLNLSSGVGGSTVITTNGVKLSCTGGGSTYTSDGSEQFIITGGNVTMSVAGTVAWLQLPDHAHVNLYNGATVGSVTTVDWFIVPKGCTVHGLGQCGWDSTTPPGPPTSTTKTVITFSNLECWGGAGADQITFIMPDLAGGNPHYWNIPFQLVGDHSGATGYVNTVVGGVASVLGW
jgi:hypothetical protein